MAKTKASGIRERGGRYYGDTRRYKAAGVCTKAEVALVAEGATVATRDPAHAAALYQALCRRYDAELDIIEAGGKGALARKPDTYVDAFVEYLLGQRGTKRLSDAYITAVAHYLDRIIEETCIGRLQDIQDITPRVVTTLIAELWKMKRAHPRPIPSGLSPEEAERFNKLAGPTVRRMCMALSAMLTHAIHEGDYLSTNPVARHRDLPSAGREGEAVWFEVQQVADMLESLALRRSHARAPYGLEIFASLVYTGARKSEVFQLGPEDIDLDRGFVILGNRKSWKLTRGRAPKTRQVPLWPHLREILIAFATREGIVLGVKNSERPLLFPSRSRDGKRIQKMQTCIVMLRKLAASVGYRGAVHEHMTRHTYAACRLATCERVADGSWAAVAPLKVAHEYGHQGTDVLLSTYAHALRQPVLMTDVLDYRTMAQAPVQGYRAIE